LVNGWCWFPCPWGLKGVANTSWVATSLKRDATSSSIFMLRKSRSSLCTPTCLCRMHFMQYIF
jgi:hypothetical protein